MDSNILLLILLTLKVCMCKNDIVLNDDFSKDYKKYVAYGFSLMLGITLLTVVTKKTIQMLKVGDTDQFEIQGVITHKTEPKNGYFSFWLHDPTGKILVKAFKEESKRIMDMIQNDESITFTNGNVQYTKTKYATFPGQKEIIVNFETTVKAMEQKVDTEKPSFCDLCDLDERIGELVNVQVKIVEDNLSKIHTCTDGRVTKRKITVVLGAKGTKMIMNFWGKEFEKMEFGIGAMVEMLNVRVTSYNDTVSLNSASTTITKIVTNGDKSSCQECAQFLSIKEIMEVPEGTKVNVKGKVVARSAKIDIPAKEGAKKKIETRIEDESGDIKATFWSPQADSFPEDDTYNKLEATNMRRITGGITSIQTETKVTVAKNDDV